MAEVEHRDPDITHYNPWDQPKRKKLDKRAVAVAAAFSLILWGGIGW